MFLILSISEKNLYIKHLSSLHFLKNLFKFWNPSLKFHGFHKTHRNNANAATSFMWRTSLQSWLMWTQSSSHLFTMLDLNKYYSRHAKF